MTDLIDIYEAAGAEVNVERNTVRFTPDMMKPFDIVLRVMPSAVEEISGEKAKITFDVYLDDEYVLGKTDPVHGTPVYTIPHEASLTLPVDQVRIGWWERFQVED
jgi:hypothetical protein